MGALSLNAPQLTAASSSLGGDSHLENAQETTSQQAKIFLRVDKLQFEQPVPEEANPNAAATFAPFYDMGNGRIQAGEVEEIAKKIHRKSSNK